MPAAASPRRPRPAAPQPGRVWQRMLSGRRLDLADPSPVDIEPEDIALGLARQHRWNGQTRGVYGFSVAQHSILVRDIVTGAHPGLDRRWQLAALLHDAPEFVCHDLITPLKNLVGDVFRDVENNILRAIHLRFGLPAVVPASVRKAIKTADKVAAATEAISLAGFTREELGPVLGITVPPLEEEIEAWASDVACERYLAELYALLD